MESSPVAEVSLTMWSQVFRAGLQNKKDVGTRKAPEYYRWPFVGSSGESLESQDAKENPGSPSSRSACVLRT